MNNALWLWLDLFVCMAWKKDHDESHGIEKACKSPIQSLS